MICICRILLIKYNFPLDLRLLQTQDLVKTERGGEKTMEEGEQRKVNYEHQVYLQNKKCDSLTGSVIVSQLVIVTHL